MQNFYLLAVGAGASVAFQQILNSNLRIELGSPWWAGFASYFVGMIVMLATAMIAPGTKPSFNEVAGVPWIFWTGGFFGAIFIGGSILAVPRLGAASSLALIVVGQMVGSMIFDHYGGLGIAQHPISPVRIGGALLLAGGVVLIRL
ncbi:transporter family-2 protein [Rhizobium sp. BK060]|nr:transporter family-2 protein [Rhizobium sp. BK060]